MRCRRFMLIPRSQNEPSYPFKATFWKGLGTAAPAGFAVSTVSKTGDQKPVVVGSGAAVSSR
jgi:hypothetical protein